MLTSAFKPAAGRFLISEPFMYDQNFQRTVVLLVEHGETGSLGFVMNRMVEVGIDEIVDDFSLVDASVFMGGPVEQSTLHYVHRLGDMLPHSREVMDGLYWGGSFETLKSKIHSGLISEEDILFFVGYSGWAPGQLEQELERKSWIVAPDNLEFVFRKDYTDLWRLILQSMGTKYKVIANYPVDPRLN
ncbi:MAG: YqgE/AlgH family protein [Bacteroidota bacterium]